MAALRIKHPNTLREQIKAGHIPDFDVKVSQKTRYWHQRTLVKAGILKPDSFFIKENPNAHIRRHHHIAAICLVAVDIQSKPGVYFLIGEDGYPVYVGQSSNVMMRIARHYDKGFIAARMLVIEDERKRLDTEAELIKYFKPVFNIALKPGDTKE